VYLTIHTRTPSKICSSSLRILTKILFIPLCDKQTIFASLSYINERIFRLTPLTEGNAMPTSSTSQKLARNVRHQATDLVTFIANQAGKQGPIFRLPALRPTFVF